MPSLLHSGSRLVFYQNIAVIKLQEACSGQREEGKGRILEASLLPFPFPSSLVRFLFPLPSLPRTQRDLCGGESDNPSCFVFEMLLCLHVVVLSGVVFKMLLHVYLFVISWYVFVVTGENFRNLTLNFYRPFYHSSFIAIRLFRFSYLLTWTIENLSTSLEKSVKRLKTSEAGHLENKSEN